MFARLKDFYSSYVGRLLLGTLAINVLLVPLLFGGLLQREIAEDKLRFVDQARSKAQMLTEVIESRSAAGLGLMIDELVLGEQVVYADYQAIDGSSLVSVHNARGATFKADSFFGDHGDHVYFIALPARDGSGGVLRVGFSELPIEDHIAESYRHGTLVAVAYLLLTLTLVAFFGRLLYRSVGRLKAVSRAVAGGTAQRMSVDTGVAEFSSLADDLECMRQTLRARELEIAQREAKQRAVLETAAEGIITVDPQGRIESFNKAAETLFGYRAEEMIGGYFDELLQADGAAKFRNHAGLPVICSGTELAGRRKSGEACDLVISVTEATAGECRCFTILVQDISGQRAYEGRLAHLATHDILTGLPNRALHGDRLNQALAHAARHDNTVALLFLDLDRFKNINDTLGHHVGDELLQVAASRLAACLRSEDTLARLGGDEFTVILPDLERAEDASVVAENIVRTLERPFMLAGRELFISCSVGIAVFPGDGREAAELSKNADAAMYATKSRGGCGFQFYSREMNAEATSRLELESSLRYALERGELLLHYQPQVDVISQRIIGVEALLRWRHPVLGLVPPAKFIPLAEETGLIVPISDWMLEHACRQGRVWQDQGMAVTVSVNLSARHFRQPGLLETLRAILAATGFQPGLLDLELTESMVMDHGEETVALLHRFKELGVALSMDDFGTGYSSLSYLKRFPLDTLKIDRSFVDGICGDHYDGTLAATIIAMARLFRMRVIAEGVEMADQLERLRILGCDAYQGHYFSEPLPVADVTALLERDRRQGLPGGEPVLQAVLAGAA